MLSSSSVVATAVAPNNVPTRDRVIHPTVCPTPRVGGATHPVSWRTAMDRQSTFLLAMGMLIAAGIAVSAAGWTLFVRDRRAHRPIAATSDVSPDATHHEAPEER